jgi:Zn finger protein HypA/HybF involved in hydrogenase expression
MAKTKGIKGNVWCFGCQRIWEVPNKHAYLQCPICKNYRVYAVGTLAYYHAIKEKEGSLKK